MLIGDLRSLQKEKNHLRARNGVTKLNLKIKVLTVKTKEIIDVIDSI